MQVNLCHKEEAIKLFITKVRPLYDILGINHFHFSSRPLTFSVVPSQFFCTVVSSPRNTPKYLKPYFFHTKPGGREKHPLFQSPISSASLFSQLTLAEDSFLKSSSTLIKTFTSLC